MWQFRSATVPDFQLAGIVLLGAVRGGVSAEIEPALDGRYVINGLALGAPEISKSWVASAVYSHEYLGAHPVMVAAPDDKGSALPRIRSAQSGETLGHDEKDRISEEFCARYCECFILGCNSKIQLLNRARS
jgi:hypothetical protein